MKKILSYVLLAAMLVGCMIPALAISAADDAKITAATANPAWREETFTTAVSISDNPGVSTLKLIVYFKDADISGAELVFGEDALFSEDEASATNPVAGTNNKVAKYLNGVVDNPGDYKAFTVDLEKYDGDDAANVTTDGKLFDIIYSVNGEPDSNTVLSCGVVLANAENADGEGVTFSSTSAVADATVQQDPYVGNHDEVTIFAAGPETISLGTKKVSVQIRLDGNKVGLWGGTLVVAYDSKWKVDYDSETKAGDGLVGGNLWIGEGSSTTYNIVSYDSPSSKLALQKCGKYDAASEINADVVYGLFEMSEKNCVEYEGGVIFTVTFDVPSDAKVGDQLKILLANVGDFVTKEEMSKQNPVGMTPAFEDLTITVAAVECKHEQTHENVIDPTCEEDGATQTVCDECGAVISSTPIPATGHQWVAGTVVEATCTEKGYTNYECSACHETKQDDSKDPLGHDETTEDKDPTCTEDGYHKVYCKRCNEVFTNDVKTKLGHTEAAPVVKTLPTCTEDGYTTVSCARCGALLHESHPAKLGHKEKVEINEPATYDADGHIKIVCERCQEVLKDEVLPRLTVSATVKCIIVNGNDVTVITETTTDGLYKGDSFKAQRPEIPGYTPTDDGAEKEIQLGETDNVIYFEFTANTDITYTVKYVDENGKELAPAKEVKDQTMASTVTEKAIEIKGYTADAAEKTLTLAADGNEIVFTYKADKVVDDGGKGTTPDNNSKPNGNSQTGDNFIFVVIALVVAAAGAATVVIVRRKRQH